MGTTPTGDFGPRMCEVSCVGARQRTRGVAPEALEECLHSSKGYKRRPAWLLHWGGRPVSFSAGIGTLSAGLGILRAGRTTQCPA